MTLETFLEKAFSRCETVKNSYFRSYGNTALEYVNFSLVGSGFEDPVQLDDWFEVVVSPGVCEGAYIEVYMYRCGFDSTTRSCVGVVKTLQTSKEAYQDLGKLAGELQYQMLHLNIHEE